MSIYKNGKLIAGGKQCTPLLSFMWADHMLNDVSWLRADTFSWQAGSVYEAAYQHLVDDINNAEIASIWNDSYEFDRDVADDDLAREAPYAWKHGSRIVYTKSDKPKINDTIYEVDPQSTYGTVVAVVPVYRTETVNGITIQFYLADDGHKICPASEENNVMAIYNTTGVAWYYIIDTTNERFKLPRTKFGFTGIRSGVGNYVEAGLPDLSGSVNVGMYGDPSGTGVFTDASAGYNWPLKGTHTQGYGGNVPFNASNGNSIYGNSDTVQPKATEMYLYFYVGGFTQTAIENTAGLNAELFNDKVDKGHQVIAFQTPTAENNYTWYRKYADGWVEQGGHYTHDNVEKTVTTTLAVVMADAHYNLQITKELSSAATTDMNYQFMAAWVLNSKTTTQFQTRMTAANRLNGYDWQVSGMAA